MFSSGSLQTGFCPHHSTKTALLGLCFHIAKSCGLFSVLTILACWLCWMQMITPSSYQYFLHLIPRYHPLPIFFLPHWLIILGLIHWFFLFLPTSECWNTPDFSLWAASYKIHSFKCYLYTSNSQMYICSPLLYLKIASSLLYLKIAHSKWNPDLPSKPLLSMCSQFV